MRSWFSLTVPRQKLKKKTLKGSISVTAINLRYLVNYDKQLYIFDVFSRRIKPSKIWQLGKQNPQRNLCDSGYVSLLITEIFTKPINKHKHSRRIGQNLREIPAISSLQTYTGSFKDVLGKIWLSLRRNAVYRNIKTNHHLIRTSRTSRYIKKMYIFFYMLAYFKDP